MVKLSRMIFAALAAGVVLALTACGGGEEAAAEAFTGQAISPIPKPSTSPRPSSGRSQLQL